MNIESFYPEGMLPFQRRFHEACSDGSHYGVCMSGGVGCGKSRVALTQIVYDSSRFNNFYTLCILPYDSYLEDFVVEQMENWFGLTVHEEEEDVYRFGFNNGSKIRFVTPIRFLRAYLGLQRSEYLYSVNRIFFEEASELGLALCDSVSNLCSDEEFMSIGLRYASANIANVSPLIVAQNPKGKNYVWKFFIEGAKETKKEHWSIHQKSSKSGRLLCITALTSANTFLPPSYVQSVMQIEAERETMRNAVGVYIPSDDEDEED